MGRHRLAMRVRKISNRSRETSCLSFGSERGGGGGGRDRGLVLRCLTVRIDLSCSSVVEGSRLLRGDSGARDPGRADNDARPSVLNTGRATRFWFSSSEGLFLLAGFCLQGRLPRSSRKPLPSVVTVSTLRANPPSFCLIAPPLPAGTKPSKQPTGGLHHAWHC